MIVWEGFFVFKWIEIFFAVILVIIMGMKNGVMCFVFFLFIICIWFCKVVILLILLLIIIFKWVGLIVVFVKLFIFYVFKAVIKLYWENKFIFFCFLCFKIVFGLNFFILLVKVILVFLELNLVILLIFSLLFIRLC